MITLRQCKYSKLFTFETEIVFIPESLNRKGIDPLPRYWARPTRLLYYRNYSYNASSVNNGYTKDQKLNLYIKNIDKIDKDFVDMQFEFIKNQPPYGFNSESSYVEFVEKTFAPAYSSTLEAQYLAGSNKAFVKKGVDPAIARDHHTAKGEATTLRSFYFNKIVQTGRPDDSFQVVDLT